MPIEIRELHIRINVNEGGKSSPEKPPKEKDKNLVEECVEQVMLVIERQKER